MGEALRAAGVGNVALVHGTFVGQDPWGLLAELARLVPDAGDALRVLSKACVDRAVGQAGNYTRQFAAELERGLSAAGTPIGVARIDWSGQNNHLGRAEGVVRVVEALARPLLDGNRRVLLWGHSHAGNVFALLSQLLGGGRRAIDAFFRTVRVYYRWPIVGWIDLPRWRRARTLLYKLVLSNVAPRLDLVTFGTPIRYGWNPAGYGRLLHFINHRPAPGLPPWQAPFPPQPQRMLAGLDGDYVQQLGIAGTNLAPSLFAWRALWADARLNRLLQPDLEPAGVYERFRAGARVPEEGTTLLVDYGPPAGHVGQHLAGHAVYTERPWLLFHAEETARRFYTTLKSP